MFGSFLNIHLLFCFVLINLKSVILVDASPYNNGISILDIIRNNGYPVELYDNLRTEDDYLLDMQRIPHGKSINNNGNVKNDRTPILFIPALLTSAEIYLMNSGSLPYMLADAGYDIWLSNTRGSIYSRKHVYLPTNTNSSYWSYSWHEKGYYDVATFIDTIRNITGHNKVITIGYSEGTTDLTVLLTERPEYNEKIKLAIFLAPSIYLSHTSNEATRYYAARINIIKNLFYSLGIRGVYFDQEQINNLRNPKFYNKTKMFCETLLASLMNIDQFDKFYNMTSCELAANALHGISVKELVHYAQLINHDDFRYYDYGKERNKIIYGNKIPPRYNLEKITAPIAIYYSVDDYFTTAKDMKRISKNLRSTVYIKKIANLNFTHYDFVIHPNVKTIINDDLLNVLTYFNNF